MILIGVGGVLPTAFRSPSRKINRPFDQAGDDKTGSYETQPSAFHAKSHRLGSRHTLSIEVTQAVELLLGLRDAKPGPDSWQKRIMINFEDERTDGFFPRSVCPPP
jgi:hypothetical protein